MLQGDQAARRTAIQGMRKSSEGEREATRTLARASAKVEAADRANAILLHDILERYGWPPTSEVGQEASDAMVVILAHHAPLELAERALPLVLQAAERGEATEEAVARIEDRVLVGRRQPQLLGTQWRSRRGQYEPYPIRDPEGVDQRRKALGLPTLEEHRQVMEETFGPAPRLGVVLRILWGTVWERFRTKRRKKK